jgi:CelD/BcsL family acetyltransferase involved in cellulose biosynthesis
MIVSEIKYHLLKDFDDPAISPELWNGLLHQGSTDEIFLTWQWQKTWWEVFGRGDLLLIMAEKNGEPLCIAPLFADQGMIFFTGSGGSDYLDFIGEIPDIKILEKMLAFAREATSDFKGFLFYHIPASSGTHNMLADVAGLRNWYSCEEGEYISPRIEMNLYPDSAGQSIMKKSLRRHETWFIRNGNLKVNHFQTSNEILPHLGTFFRQHIDRWLQTPYPSLFLKNEECRFYRQLTEILSDTGWLRFTVVEWNNTIIAFHFGFYYQGSFFWYKPSFDISMARNSPGEVLIRHLLLNAVSEKAHIFDFGLGDETFKRRFSTTNRRVINQGVYPF